MKFRKKPVVIEAMQWDGTENSATEIVDKMCRIGIDSLAFDLKYLSRGKLLIHTLEGVHEASVGDWIVKGVKGEFYPVKPDIFEQTYELVE